MKFLAKVMIEHEPGGTTIVEYSGNIFRLRRRPLFRDDRGAFFQATLVDEYSRVWSRVQLGDTVIDLGANIGCFTIPAARLVGPNGRVIAVEANPENFSQLRQNVALNKLDNVILVNSAVAGEPGGRLRVTGSGLTAHVSGTEGEQMDTVTLPGLISTYKISRVGCLKVDIEGSELQVFQSPQIYEALNITRSVGIEVHSREAEISVRNRLVTAGFSEVTLRRESDYALPILRSVLLNPLATVRLYGRDAVAVVARVLFSSSRYSPSTQDIGRGTYDAGVITSLKPMSGAP